MVMEERFQRGELVTLREHESGAEPLGRIVSVTSDGERAEISWQPPVGQEHRVTVEPTALLRRVHESEMNP
jgi:hypothetical protein